MRKGTNSIFALWEKAAKAKKKKNKKNKKQKKTNKKKQTASTSTPNSPPVEIENNLQVALVQAQDDGEAQAQSAVEANDEAHAHYNL